MCPLGLLQSLEQNVTGSKCGVVLEGSGMAVGV